MLYKSNIRKLRYLLVLATLTITHESLNKKWICDYSNVVDVVHTYCTTFNLKRVSGTSRDSLEHGLWRPSRHDLEIFWLLEERRILLPQVLIDGRARSKCPRNHRTKGHEWRGSKILRPKEGWHERTSKKESRRREIHKKKAIHNNRKRVKTKGSDYRTQSCGSWFISGSGSSISSESGSESRVLMTKNWRKKIRNIKKFLNLFFDQKLQFTYVQATGEAFGPQKRTSSTSKNEIY